MKRLIDILREIIGEEKEWIIWGVPPGKREEEILFTKAKSSGEAEKVKRILTDKWGCKGVRIQTLDISKGTDFSKEFGGTVREADSPTERTRRYNRKNKGKVRAYLKKTQDDRVARNGDRRKAEKKHGKAKIKNKDIHHPNGPKNGNYKIVKKDHGPDKKS